MVIGEVSQDSVFVPCGVVLRYPTASVLVSRGLHYVMIFGTCGLVFDSLSGLDYLISVHYVTAVFV